MERFAAPTFFAAAQHAGSGPGRGDSPLPIYRLPVDSLHRFTILHVRVPVSGSGYIGEKT